MQSHALEILHLILATASNAGHSEGPPEGRGKVTWRNGRPEGDEYLAQRAVVASNRSQFGCELGLCGEATDSARKRNFEPRDWGTFAARRPANRGAETARIAETYALTRG